MPIAPLRVRCETGGGYPAIEITGGPRERLHTSACRETHPRDVSELSANRTSAFYRRHNLPRCDVHSKEKGGNKGSVTGLSWCTGRRGKGWDDNGDDGRCMMTRMRGYFDPINRTERLLWKSVVSLICLILISRVVLLYHSLLWIIIRISCNALRNASSACLSWQFSLAIAKVLGLLAYYLALR